MVSGIGDRHGFGVGVHRLESQASEVGIGRRVPGVGVVPLLGVGVAPLEGVGVALPPPSGSRRTRSMTVTLSLSHTHTHTLSLSLSLTHTHTTLAGGAWG